MTRTEVRNVLDRVSAIWGRRSAAPAVADEWFKALADYPAIWANSTLDAMIRAGAPGPNLPEFVALLRTRLPRPSTETAADPDWRPVPADRIRQLLAAGIEQGRAQRLAAAQAAAQEGAPAVLARLQWWSDGGSGHYPGCSCARCTT